MLNRFVHDPTRRRGVALVSVLWIGVLAGLVLVTVQRTTRVDTAMARGELAAVQARWLARAGVEQAIAILTDDTGAYDSSLDWWYEDREYFENVELATGTFAVIAPPDPDRPAAGPRFGLLDLAGRINLNHADREQLERLEMLDEQQARAILDWRGAGGRGQGGEGARAYYERLPFGYEMRGGPFQTVDELRLVRYIDDRTFFGEEAMRDVNAGGMPRSTVLQTGETTLDRGLAGMVTVHAYEPNTDDFGSDRVDVNEAEVDDLRQQLNVTAALARGIVQQRGNNGFDTLFELTDVSPQQQQRQQQDDDDPEDAVDNIDLEWIADNIDRLTLTDDDRIYGRINLNTARRDVLLTLPDVTEADADSIIAHRDSASGPYRSAGDLYHTPGISDALFRAIAERVTVRSNVFRVTSIGVSHTGARQRITAVIDRGDEPMTALYWHEGR